MRASRYPGQRRLWDRARATSTTQRLSSPGQSQRHLTEKYSLELRLTEKRILQPQHANSHPECVFS